MAADAVSWLPTHQTDESNFDENFPAYMVADHDNETNEHDMNEQKLLAIQYFKVAQQKAFHHPHLLEIADNPDSSFLYNKFDIFYCEHDCTEQYKNSWSHLQRKQCRNNNTTRQYSTTPEGDVSTAR